MLSQTPCRKYYLADTADKESMSIRIAFIIQIYFFYQKLIDCKHFYLLDVGMRVRQAQYDEIKASGAIEASRSRDVMYWCMCL